MYTTKQTAKGQSAEGSWVWYTSPQSIIHNNTAYIGAIDNDGNIKAVVFKEGKRQKEEITLREKYEPDEHSHPAFLTLDDNRIMVIYSGHFQKNSFHYKVSAPDDLTKLSEEKRAVVTNNNSTFTYPNIFKSNEGFYVTYRGENWHPTIAKLSYPDKNNEIKIIQSPRQIVQSTAQRPYVRYFSKDNKIYMAYTLGHADNELPNPIFFSVLDPDTLKLYDVQGTLLKDIDSSPFEITKDIKNPALVVENDENSRNCVWDLILDKDNIPLILYAKISPDKQKHDYYFAYWNKNEWIKEKLFDNASYFHGVKGVEETFSGGLAFDKNNPKRIFMSVPKKGLFGKKYEIVQVELDDKYKIKDTKQITRNSLSNNVRPQTLKGLNRLLWLYGKYDYWYHSNKNIGFPFIIKDKKI